MRSVELFAGAGGLAMGVSNAGFTHDAVIESNAETCVTIRANQARGIQPVADWPLREVDVTRFDYGDIRSGLDLLAGGPPCQPFSLGGKHRGHEDRRNMFPEAVRAVRELAPKAFLFENVKGLLRQSFSSYFEYIILQLSHPEVARATDEDWTNHLARLERFHTTACVDGLNYRVVHRLMNAADYGVPQCRERVIIVGFREDLGVDWSFPEPTHSRDALLYGQWISGEYWDTHRIAKIHRPPPPRIRARRLTESRASTPMLSPWRTVREAISDLPDPSIVSAIPNHRFQPGSRSYPGHTGSILDWPAKTLKAGDHGVPGGENMIAQGDGRPRYFTVRECARLQTFPDEYIFPVAWTESMRQLGNAVPVTLASVIARSVHERLAKANGMRGKNDGSTERGRIRDALTT